MSGLKNKIQTLIDKINTTTGNNDTTLYSAVNSVCTGYGQGGGTGTAPTKPYIIETVDVNNDITGFELCGNHRVIRNGMFYTCKKLTSVSLPDSIGKIGENSFRNCVELTMNSLPYNLVTIGQYAFYNCTKLAITHIPDNVAEIGSAAFGACAGITELTFNGQPSNIATNTFNGCTNLTLIRVPWSYEEIPGAPWGATNATIVYNYQEV